MTSIDFKYCQDELSDLLNFTAGVVDQNFTTAQLKKALNRAYKREVRKGKVEGHSAWYKVGQVETWPSGQQTFDLPNGLDQRNILRVYDQTDNDPGIPLDIASEGNSGRMFFKDRNTLQWSGQGGPGQDKTLNFVYTADATEMVSDGDEPFLIPPENRELLWYSAAVDLRERADEVAPGSWHQKLSDAQMDYWKVVSRGRPSDMVPTIRVVRAQDNTFVYYN